MRYAKSFALGLGSLVALGAIAAACGGNGGSGGSGASSNGGHAAGTGASGHGGSGAGNASGGGGGFATGSGGSSGKGGSGTANGGASGTGGAAACVQATCKGHTYQCGDCIDNDGDMKVDSADSNCLGPCQDSEDHFGGIPGQNNSPCKMDCYFDFDTGRGNDNCYWDHRCDPHEMDDPNPGPEPPSKCGYDPNFTTQGKTCAEMQAMQSNQCHTVCGPLVPNGCDCFGCCELPAGSNHFVWMGSTDANGDLSCDINSVNDPLKCHQCTKVDSCFNSCKHCELCVGKDHLPDDCSSSSTSSTGTGGGCVLPECSSGVQPCGVPCADPCAAGFYCNTGCCQKVPS